MPAATGRGAGPGSRVPGQPFYNPAMALNRDLSVLLVEAEAARLGRAPVFADVLAGAGARSLRVAREVEADVDVHANDAGEAAGRALSKAAASSKRITVHHREAHAFLASGRFDIVDLDPYGSPMPFADAAIRATRHGGLLCATATDTAALCGTFPRVTRRRYDAAHELHKWPWRAEVGLRILAGALVRAASRQERGATPVLSVAAGHWMRVVVRVTDGAAAGDTAMERLGHAWAEETTGNGCVGDAPAATPSAGPVWSGPLHDASLVAALQDARSPKRLACARQLNELLPQLAAEGDPRCPAFWLDPDPLARVIGSPPPRRDRLMARLREAGFVAERSHIEPKGIRTDADLAGLKACWTD